MLNSLQLSILMLETSQNYREVIIADLEKHIDAKTVQKFLEASKLMNKVSKFGKNKDNVCLEFNSESDARAFIQEHNLRTKIMARTFNIFYSIFEGKEGVKRFEVNGVEQKKLRRAFDLCDKYGPCRFRLTYENNKLSYNCVIELLEFDLEKDFQALKSQFSSIDLKIRPEQTFGDSNQFRCSIQLTNFTPIKETVLTPEDEAELTKILTNFVGKATGEELSYSQFHPYQHKGQTRVKAYFQFRTLKQTFDCFQRLRKYLLELPEITCKLFYFQHQSDSYCTLFIKGLINPQDLPDKVYENSLIQVFRQINPNITQITVRKQYSNYTAKIYLKDEDAGKDFLVDYGKHRSILYTFFKPNTPISINTFISNTQQKKQQVLEKNGMRIINKLQQQKQKNKPGPFGNQPQMQSILQQGYQYQGHQQQGYYAESWSRPAYRRREGKGNGYREKEEEVKKEEKQQFKEKTIYKEDDFPQL